MNEVSVKNNDVAIEKLEKQNEKLRSELKELKKALDASRKKINNKASQGSDNAEDKETLTVNAKIKKFKQETLKMTKELEGNLNISKITDLENQSIFLSKKLAELESEQSLLKKIEKEQQNALNSAQSSNTYPEKINQLRDDIRLNKEKYKELSIKHKQEEKIYRIQHEKCVDLEEKCRKLYDFIKKTKEEEKKNDGEMIQEEEITENDKQRLEEKIKKTEEIKNEEEGKIKNKIKASETQIREGNHHLAMLKIKLKEKDQECRLNLLKIKELRKAMKHNQLKPLLKNTENNTPKGITPVMSSESNIGIEKIMIKEEEEIENTNISETASEKLKAQQLKSENDKFFHQQTLKNIQKIMIKPINFADDKKHIQKKGVNDVKDGIECEKNDFQS